MAEISESDYQEWLDVYHRASTAIQNRVLKLEESYELIEKVCVACSFLGFGLVGGEDGSGRRDEQKSGSLMIVLIFYTMRSESLLRNSA